MAVDVDGDDCLCSVSDGRGDPNCGSIVQLDGSTSTNTGFGTGTDDGADGGEEGVRDSDHLVAGTDADRFEGQLERSRSAGDGDAFRCLAEGGELCLEGNRLGPGPRGVISRWLRALTIPSER